MYEPREVIDPESDDYRLWVGDAWERRPDARGSRRARTLSAVTFALGRAPIVIVRPRVAAADSSEDALFAARSA